MTQDDDFEQLIQTFSHDLREPARTLSSFSKLLRGELGDNVSSRGKEMLDHIEAGASKLQARIEAIAEYAKLTTRKPTISTFQLEECFSDALGSMQPLITSTDAMVTRDALPEISGDKLLISRCIRELIKNGIMYGAAEHPQVHLAVSKVGASIQIAVTDNGDGFVEGFANSVGKPLQKHHWLPRHIGLGLGLALCEKVAKRHGGEIAWERVKSGHFTARLIIPQPAPLL